MRNKTIKKILTTILTCSVIMSSSLTSAFAKTSAEIKEEINGYKEDLRSAQEIEEEIENQIEETKSNIADLTSEVKDLALQIEEYKEGMITRMQYFYEKDEDSVLEDILESNSFAEMLNKFEYQQSLYDYDEAQLEEYKKYNEELEQKEEELQENEEALETLLEEQEALEQELQETIMDKEAEYEETKAEEERMAEEERKKAEEAKLAEQQAAQSSSSSTSSSSGSTVSYTNNYANMSYSDIQMDVATKIYSVLKYIGWNDYQIAGALGNIQTECSFDFTSVEWVSWHCNESFSWGPTKQAAADKDYIMSAINPNYSFSKVYRTGIGLIQWTDTTDGATGNSSLRAYASAHGKNWYDLDLQLMYLTDYNGDSSRAKYIRNWTQYQKYSTNNLYDACSWWSYYIEGCFYDTEKRQSLAQSWYNNLSSMTYDEEYAKKILSGNI